MDTRSDIQSVPLVVDLDGTLIESDLLHECVLRLLRQNPLFLLMFPTWLAGGKARFKHEVFSRVVPDPQQLRFRESVVEALRQAKIAGRHTVLATASDQRHAEAISDHLGTIETVMGSTRDLNLRSGAKADALIEKYGDGGFDYFGNSADDVAVFDGAREATAVAPDKQALKWALEHDAPIVDGSSASPKQYLKLLRVHQWAKNLLIAVPVVLDHRIGDATALAQVAIAFFAFSFVASAVYIINDLFDLASDRKHPTKHKRPLAACTISIASGLKIAFALLVAAVSLTLLLPPVFGLVLVGYFILTTAYSLRIKQFMLIDVLVLASLYTVRVIAGAAATTIAPSFWLLAFSVFFFLSLALVKRYVELDQAEIVAKEKLAGRGYRREDKDVLGQAGMASGFASVVVLALYLDSPAIYALYAEPWMIWPLCPLVLYIIIRIWILAHRAEFNDDPVVFVMTDWRSQFMIGAGALMLLLASIPIHG
ncbi:MAG: UbiA family prenyltransferase [Pseudomonadota bacterium]